MPCMFARNGMDIITNGIMNIILRFVSRTNEKKHFGNADIG